MSLDFSLFKKHPAITIGVGLVAAFVFYELVAGGSAATTTTSSSTDPNADALAASEAQTAASTAQQGAAINYNETSQQLTADTGTAQQVNAINGDIALATINATNQQAIAGGSNSTQIAINTNNNDTQVSLGQIASSLQTAIANIGSSETLGYANIVTGAATAQDQINAGVQTTLAGYQYGETLAQIQGATTVEGEAINASKSSSTGNFLNGIVGGVVGSFL